MTPEIAQFAKDLTSGATTEQEKIKALYTWVAKNIRYISTTVDDGGLVPRDSCLEDGAHHAYSQPENDDQPVYVVKVGGKEFLCHAWMLAQAKEFIDLVQCMSDVIELEIYGGLLRQILQSGADRAALEEF